MSTTVPSIVIGVGNNEEHTLFFFCVAGHTAKAFHVRWSPLKKGCLCSGSDDT